ncbi:hypothetical protein NW762_011645 [Fusarium torreyae]|uniref:Uncharacterized protein n=1 Tax=Fusarium torreyae TaxID=1237075 RepID=A0A9W8VAC7_9HYPO|nr:hypothetical protein NW762_011645 [Fusarium torreyae]
MAKISAKCEFMDNALPAGNLSLQGKFYVAEDENGEHMIFSLDKRGQLCLVLKGPNGHNELINLSSRLGLADSEKVSSFAVSQNSNGDIHLCLTARNNDAADRLLVMPPTSGNRNAWTCQFDPYKDLYTGEQWGIHVRELLLGTSNDSSTSATAYPQIYLILKHLSMNTEDIWALTVNVDTKSWTNPKTFQMPCNPDKIIDKCVANLKQGNFMYRGMFVLYQKAATDPTKLSFVGFNPTKENPTLRSINQKVPPGAAFLSSIENGKGSTDLIVCGAELTWHKSRDCLTGTPSWTTLSKAGSYSDVCQLHIAQSDNVISAWTLHDNHTLAYQEFDFHEGSAPTPRTPLIPLLDQTQSTNRFAALQNPKLGQKLFVVNDKNTMGVMEQSVETALWMPPVDVVIPQSDEIIEFKSHTIRAEVTDEQGALLANRALRVCSSTSAELIINGRSIRGSPDGQVVETDGSGTITIIIRNDGLASPIITFDGKDSTDNLLKDGPFTVDPMSKLWSTVNNIKSAQDLRNITMPDGSSFMKPGISNDDLDKAAKALQDLIRVRQELTPHSSVQLANSSSTNATVGDRLWGSWYRIRDSIETGFQWIIEKVGDVWKFIVHLAGETWTFVLGSYTQVAEAMQKILVTITPGWDHLKKMYEFVFYWDDILDFKNVLVNITTQGMLWGIDGISLLEFHVDNFFNDLRQKARHIKSANLPSELSTLKPGKKEDLESQVKQEKGDIAQEALGSPGTQYGLYHLNHSGILNEQQASGQTSLDRLQQRLGDVYQQVEHLISRLQGNFEKLAQSKNLTVEEILMGLGVDLLEDTIGVTQSVVMTLLTSFGDLILLLVEGINEAITIPVLSPQYRKLTRGADLTILDAIALVIAIPGTYLFGIITGKKPRGVVGIDSLTKLNVMKPELDEKIGHAKFKAPGEKPTGSFYLSQEEIDAIKYYEKQFISSISVAMTILKVVGPAGGMMWYIFRTWPTLAIPQPYNLKMALFSSCKNLVFWIVQFASISHFSDGRLNINELLEDPGFSNRFYSWMVGGLPICGALEGKEAEQIHTLVSGMIQTVLLADLQIRSWTGEAGYSTYLTAEEWSKLLGKVFTAASGLTKGGGGYGAATALVFTVTGGSLNILRVSLEIAGKREILCTGIGLET